MVYKSIFILGRQPELGRAELESIFGANTLESIGERAIACTTDPSMVSFKRLGGSVRVAKLLDVLPTNQWQSIVRGLGRILPELLATLPEGKIKLGLSAFGLQVRTPQLVGAGLELKKRCRSAGRTARVVPNTELELSSAQAIHNQLAGPLGVELLLIAQGSKTYVAQTVTVQDIEAYSRRDQNRPKRDARVGMLPPKLAQIIVNLATATLPTRTNYTVLDPFCGTGVVLQEALLTGYAAYGTDLETRMIDFTTKNLEWLSATHKVTANTFHTEQGDATSHQWKHPFDVVACETYLGRPLSSWPPADTLRDVIETCNLVIKKFLSNIGEQCPSGTRLCLAVPVWRNPNGKNHHLPFLDHLEEMGYNRVSFEHVDATQLVYYRPNQIVARELLVITRK